MCVLTFGAKGPLSLVGITPVHAFNNAPTLCAPPQCIPARSSLLSPDMTSSAVCNDSSNLLGDTDELAAEKVIIL